jgi:hypothetical protein
MFWGVGARLGELRHVILNLTIQRSAEPIGPMWRSVERDWIAATTEEVQGALDHKASALPGYRSSCDEVWLVIWSDERRVSSSFRLDREGDRTRLHH